MTDSTLANAVNELIALGVSPPSQILGCSENEIAQIEKWSGNLLPGVYREFLRTMGRQAGYLFRGDDVFFEDLRGGLRQTAEEIVGSAFLIPNDAIVFWMHEGYQFMYIRTSEGSDPPVYFYQEGNPSASKDYERFSEFLLDWIASASKMHSMRMAFRAKHGLSDRPDRS